MRFAGRLLVAAAAAAALAPASAAALDTRELRVADPAERECAERLLPAGTPGAARGAWTAPAEGYLTLKLGGDPYAPDWDLAARSGGATYASTNSGSTEVVTLWVREGDRVAIQACRLAGGDRSVPLTVELFETEIPEDGPRASLERVFLDRPEDLAKLERLGLDVGHDVTPTAAPVVLHSAAERRLLAQHGFGSEVLVRDLAAADRRQLRREARANTRSNLPSGRDSYRQYEDFTTEMKALAAQYPGHVRSITIGTTLEGRPIEGVEIAGNVNAADDGRPVFLNLGGHHAREWPSSEFPMEFAIDLARGYGTDPRVTSMLDRVRVITVPVVNADGFVASRSFGSTSVDDDEIATAPQSLAGTGAYRRKNCRGVTPADQAIPCTMRASGVDLNRNYGAYWGGPGSSGVPADQRYRGEGPFSEPESQAVLDLSESIHPTVVISNHTFLNDGKWLRQPGWDAAFMPQGPIPGGGQGAISPDEPAMKALGDAMGQATGWTSELGYETLGNITGATEDWNYFAQGAYGYTPEARGTNFHANYADMVVAEYLGPSGGVREAFMRAGEEAADTDNHGVITGAAPPGATLRIDKKFTLPVCDGEDCENGNGDPVDYEIRTELAVPSSGQYSWHVNQSTRPDVYRESDPPLEAWSMTCKRPDQERSPAQQVLIRRGEQATVDWTGLCGSDPGGGGGGQQELPTCGGKEVTIIGTDAGDKIVATEESDVIVARAGDDKVLGGGADDTVCGGGGEDSLKGGGGADELFGQAGGDLLKGEKGKDVLRGAKGKDTLNGGPGKNTCVGGSGKDSLRSC
jgi:hypothetical protein